MPAHRVRVAHQRRRMPRIGITDRAQVLADKGIQDTSGKTWNGTTWAAPTAGAPAPAPNQAGQSGPWNGAGVPAGAPGLTFNRKSPGRAMRPLRRPESRAKIRPSKHAGSGLI
jgi:hypothetical protein